VFYVDLFLRSCTLLEEYGFAVGLVGWESFSCIFGVASCGSFSEMFIHIVSMLIVGLASCVHATVPPFLY
jgi:hypothetical protein